MNVFMILLAVAAISVVASMLGIVWLAYPRKGAPLSKPFNRTIGRSDW